MCRWLLCSGALALSLAAQAAEVEFRDVQCEGIYPKHLQGICTDGRQAIFWCFTNMLVKTDLAGHVLKQVAVASHHGDLCYDQENVYVAVNLGKFNDPKGNADSGVYVYDARDLRETARHKTPELVYGAGAIATHAGRFIVVGGLPPGVNENYAYEYDARFRFVGRRVIPSGYTLMGIQTATYAQGSWWFGCYGRPRVLLKTDEHFTSSERYTLDCALGIAGLPDGRFLVARGKYPVRCTGSVVVVSADRQLGLKIPSPPTRLPQVGEGR